MVLPVLCYWEMSLPCSTFFCFKVSTLTNFPWWSSLPYFHMAKSAFQICTQLTHWMMDWGLSWINGTNYHPLRDESLPLYLSYPSCTVNRVSLSASTVFDQKMFSLLRLRCMSEVWQPFLASKVEFQQKQACGFGGLLLGRKPVCSPLRDLLCSCSPCSAAEWSALLGGGPTGFPSLCL